MSANDVVLLKINPNVSMRRNIKINFSFKPVTYTYYAATNVSDMTLRLKMGIMEGLILLSSNTT